MLRVYNKYKPLLPIYALWCGLGAYRGVQYYNKNYNKDYEYYLKNGWSKPQYYYLSCFGHSIVYFGLYLFPGTAFWAAVDELYNLEKAIRGIKDEDE